MAATSKRTREHRVWAHRWGPVAVLSSTEQAALGIRYDEEDDAAAETFLVRLAPGKAEPLDQQAGVARAIAASSTGALFVLDAAGVVNASGKRHKLVDPRAMVEAPASFGGGVVVAGADRLWIFSPDGGDCSKGPSLHARKLASSNAGLLVATDDGRVLLLSEPSATTAKEVTLDVSGHLATLALDDEGRIAAVSGRTVFAGDASGLRAITSAPFELHCVALHGGTVWLSSRAHGLFYVEDGVVMPKKPSLRAHSLVARHGTLVAASDLFIATSDDGLDFLTRDLAPFVRLAENRLPRFLQPEDPATV